MPREQLLGLATDVDRLLNAGATASVGNDNLLRRTRTLRELGKKVAALNPVADAVDKVTRGAGNQVGPAFLDLLIMLRQIRASLAGTGLTGELQPVAESGPWQTPLSVRDLQPLHTALTQSGTSREETIREAIRRGNMSDMRLLPSLLTALGDGYGPIAELVAKEVMPALGRAVLADLQAALAFPGKTIDERRLESIVRIDRPVGTAACLRALKEGAPGLRARALTLLIDLLPAAEVETLALEAAKDRSGEVRMAAILALRGATSDAALETLLSAALGKDASETRQAQEALQVLPHPDATPRLLRAIEEQLVGAVPPAAPKDKTATKMDDKAKAKADAARALTLEWCAGLMVTVGVRRDDERAEVARFLLPYAQGTAVKDKTAAERLRCAALEGLGGCSSGGKEVFTTLIDALSDKPPYLLAALRGLNRMTPAERAPAVEAVLKIAATPKLPNDVATETYPLLAGHLASHARLVLPFFRDKLSHPSSTYLWPFTNALRTAGPAAFPLVPDIFVAVRAQQVGIDMIHAIFQTIDPEGTKAIPALIELLNHSQPHIRVHAARYLGEYGVKARSAAPALEELLKNKEQWVVNAAEAALRLING